MLDRMTPALAGEAPARISTAARISAYEDDPFSEEAPTVDPPDAPPIQVTVPVIDNPLASFPDGHIERLQYSGPYVRESTTWVQQALHTAGRSRDGLTTKIHVVPDALGRPLRLILTGGEAHDRWVGLGVIADNVVNISRAMEKQAAP
jgi:hypothetical protein